MRKALVRIGLFFVFLMVAVAITAPAPAYAAEQKRPAAADWSDARALSPEAAVKAIVAPWDKLIQAARARESTADRRQVLAQYQWTKLRQEQLQRRLNNANYFGPGHEVVRF